MLTLHSENQRKNVEPANPRVLAVLFLAVSLIFGLPHLLIPLSLPEGARYSPLGLADGLSFDETYLYAARANRVLQGDWAPGDLDLVENRGRVNPMPFLSTWIVAAGARATGSLERVFLIADFLLPPLIFLGIFELFRRFLLSWRLAVLLALAALFFHHAAFDLPPLNLDDFYLLIGRLANRSGKFLIYSRLEPPELNVFFLLAALFALEGSMRRPFKRAVLFLGITVGLLPYVYIYYWLFMVIGLGVWLLFCLATSRKTEAIRLVSALAFSGVLIVPFAVRYLQFSQLPEVSDIFFRWNDANQQGIALLKRHLALVAVAALVTKEKSRLFLIAVSLHLGGVLCRNLHALYPSALQVIHFEVMLLDFWGFVTLGFVLKGLGSLSSLRFFYSTRRLWGAALCAALIAYAVFYQTRAILQIKKGKFVRTPEQAALFDRLNENAETNAVVVSPVFRENILIPTFTHCYVFVPNGVRTLASNDEITERFLLAWKLFNVPESRLNRIFELETYSIKADLEKTAMFHLFHFGYININYCNILAI